MSWCGWARSAGRECVVAEGFAWMLLAVHRLGSQLSSGSRQSGARALRAMDEQSSR